MRSVNLSNKNIISLQDGEYDNEIKHVEINLNINIKKVKSFDLKKDINSLAELISKCDLILSISSTVIHLSGALGVPTIVLAQYSPDWRFFDFESDYIWYQNTKILKQKKIR